MATEIVNVLPITWNGERDSEGHRTFEVVYRIKGTKQDGPYNALRTAGLPRPGAPYVYLNDIDLWAFCLPDATMETLEKQGPNKLWDVTLTFSTKPPDKQRCNDQEIEDPLLEPHEISGDYNLRKEEATVDRFGNGILNSAFELIRGKNVEFDFSRQTVKISHNVPLLQEDLLSQMINHVNSSTLWKHPARCVKLSKISWERKFYGQCYVYFRRSYEFELDLDTFDRDVLDEGTKVLHGHWSPNTGYWVVDNVGGVPADPSNPQHFDRFKDRNGENTRVILNGYGLPSGVPVGTGSGTGTGTGSGTVYAEGSIHIEKYEEANFLLLGIPSILGA